MGVSGKDLSSLAVGDSPALVSHLSSAILSHYILLPGLTIRLQVVFDANLVGAADGGTISIKLAEASEDTGTNAPLTGRGTAPGVAGPALEGGLDQVAGSVGHLRYLAFEFPG